MTDQRKDEMPEEIYISRDEYKKMYAYYLPIKDYTIYVRKDLSPPVPDDVASAIALAEDGSTPSLSDECISECRKHFKEYVGIEAAFFDDCVLLACKEILNLRDSTLSAEVRALMDKRTLPEPRTEDEIVKIIEDNLFGILMYKNEISTSVIKALKSAGVLYVKDEK